MKLSAVRKLLSLVLLELVELEMCYRIALDSFYHFAGLVVV